MQTGITTEKKNEDRRKNTPLLSPFLIDMFSLERPEQDSKHRAK